MTEARQPRPAIYTATGQFRFIVGSEKTANAYIEVLKNRVDAHEITKLVHHRYEVRTRRTVNCSKCNGVSDLTDVLMAAMRDLVRANVPPFYHASLDEGTVKVVPREAESPEEDELRLEYGGPPRLIAPRLPRLPHKTGANANS